MKFLIGHKAFVSLCTRSHCVLLSLTPWNFQDATMSPLCSHTGLVGPIPKERGRLSRMNRRYGRNLYSLIRTKLEKPIKWMEASPFSSSKQSVPYIMSSESDVHYGVWHRWGNTAPRCTSKTDGKRWLLLLVPAAPSSSAQERTTTLGGTEPYHSSWQCKESRRCCCHGHLAPLTNGDSRTSVFPRYGSMRLRSLHQSDRTTARDPVQYKRWTYQCYNSVITQHQQRWTHCFAKGDK